MKKMEPDFHPYIPPEGLIKLRQIEPFNLNNYNIQLFVNALIQLFEGDFYQYWKIKGSSGVKTSGLGVLYNWKAATSLKGIAQDGYRLPTRAEMLTLITENGFDPFANQLKETGEIYWEDPNPGTNASGFSARGTGFRDLTNGSYFGIRDEFVSWTSSDDAPCADGEATMFLLPKSSEPYVYPFPKKDGASIRLIRDTAEGWSEGETMVDFDGNIYRTVKIGNQVWLASNLITEHFQDGTKIPVVEDNDKWFALETEALCFYDNDTTNAYSVAPPEELRIHKHDLIRVKDTDTLKWRINAISETEIEIVVDGLVKAGDIPGLQVQSDWEQSNSDAPDFIKNKPEPKDQVQADWLQSDDEAPDFIKNKPEPSEGGEDGVSSYTYIAYASDATGSDFTCVFDPALDYIAIKTTTSPLTTPLAGDFAGLWKNYKGPAGEPGEDGKPGDSGGPGADGADDHSMDVYIDFLSVTPFVYNCPYAMKFTAQISEGADATLSFALNTNLTQYQKVTVTPAEIGLIILKGELL